MFLIVSQFSLRGLFVETGQNIISNPLRSITNKILKQSGSQGSFQHNSSQLRHWGALVLPLLCCDVGDEVSGGGATVGVGAQSKG